MIMAWGDIKHDHSDIFNATPAQRRRDRAIERAERLRLGLARGTRLAVRPGSTWDRIIKIVGTADGLTTDQIRRRLGYDRPTGHITRLLDRMVEANALTRQRESIGNRGQPPYVYRTMKETQKKTTTGEMKGND